MESELSILTLISWISVLAMVFGGIVPYIPQYREIAKTGNTEGFSLFVCLALLVANILRIIFWFPKQFETPLLIQSILMNITMLFLIHLCVRTKAKSDIIKKKDRVFTGSESESEDKGQLVKRVFRDFDGKYFWQWTDFQSYVECLLVFSVVGGFLMYFFQGNFIFVETIGFLAVFSEAMLGVPQFMKNLRTGSTRGMNQTMVLMWTAGDVFKTTYFIMRTAPVQFVMCGCLQIGVDLAILSQIWFYGGNGNGPPPQHFK